MPIIPMTRKWAEQYVSYAYAPPYTFYNIPSALRAEALFEILSPAPGDEWFAVIDDEVGMLGFYEYTLRGSEIELGLGLAPQYTGQGRGRGFVLNSLRFIRSRYPDFTGRLVLRVADFNQRAIRVYEACGFIIYDRQYALTDAGPVTFLCMRLSPASTS